MSVCVSVFELQSVVAALPSQLIIIIYFIFAKKTENFNAIINTDFIFKQKKSNFSK